MRPVEVFACAPTLARRATALSIEPQVHSLAGNAYEASINVIRLGIRKAELGTI
jgi:hypothetical protein